MGENFDLDSVIKNLEDQGLKAKAISHKLGISEDLIKIRMEKYKEEILKENWHFASPRKRGSEKKKKSRFRKVYSGEKGHLRTMYRPDGVFK